MFLFFFLGGVFHTVSTHWWLVLAVIKYILLLNILPSGELT